MASSFVGANIFDGSWEDIDEDLTDLDNLLELSSVSDFEHSEEKSEGERSQRAKVDPTAPCFGAVASSDDIPSTDEVEKLLSEEMKIMSFEEKKLIENEFGSADQVVTEDAETMSQLIHEVLDYLDKECPRSEKGEYLKEYRLAMDQKPEYIRNHSYLLMFLRAVKYDPQQAAHRLVTHLTEKLSLFGVDMLTKDIDMKDATEDDLEALKSECVSILPFRDKVGRIIIQIKPENLKWNITALSWRRSYWFLLMTALRDPLTQFNGAVCIIIHTGNDPSAYLDVLKIAGGTERYVPIYTVGPLYFAENPACSEQTILARYYMCRTCRTRFRAHFGPVNEHFERLNELGIILTSFKLPDHAEDALMKQMEYIYRHRLMSHHRQRLALKSDPMAGSVQFISPKKKSEKIDNKHDEQPKIITVLNDNDVLWGKGQSKNHIGNIRVQAMVDELRPRYAKSGRAEKTVIVLEVLQRVHDAGGRFLRRTKDHHNGTDLVCGWIEQSDERSREKIGKYFRN